MAAIWRWREAEIESERGDILERVFEFDQRKLKSENEIEGVRGRDSQQTLLGCNSLFLKALWLGGRDSNPDNRVQSAAIRKK